MHQTIKASKIRRLGECAVIHTLIRWRYPLHDDLIKAVEMGPLEFSSSQSWGYSKFKVSEVQASPAPTDSLKSDRYTLFEGSFEVEIIILTLSHAHASERFTADENPTKPISCPWIKFIESKAYNKC